MLSGLSRIFRKPFANVHISRKVPFAHVWQIYACGPRCCKTFHGFLHGDHMNSISFTANLIWQTHIEAISSLSRQSRMIKACQPYHFVKAMSNVSPALAWDLDSDWVKNGPVRLLGGFNIVTWDSASLHFTRLSHQNSRFFTTFGGSKQSQMAHDSACLDDM